MPTRLPVAITLGLTLAGLVTPALAAPSSKASKAKKTSKISKAKPFKGSAAKLRQLNPDAKIVVGKSVTAVKLPPSPQKDGFKVVDRPDPSKWSKHRLAQAANIDKSQVIEMTEIAVGKPAQFWTSGVRVDTSFRDPWRVHNSNTSSWLKSNGDSWASGYLEIFVTRFKPGVPLMLSCELDVTRHVEATGIAAGSPYEAGMLSPSTPLTEVVVDSRRTKDGDESTQLHVVATPRPGDKQLTFYVTAGATVAGAAQFWHYRPGDCVLSQIGD